ncbi:MAG TPA: response regulator [Myxococcales bacterium]|nr:response regulator [Myxococcales bacterium]
MTEPRRILAFDQDEFFLRAAGRALSEAGLRFCAVAEPAALEEQIQAFKPELILADRAAASSMAGDVAGLLRRTNIPLLYVVSDAGVRELIRALQAHAVEVMLKPFGRDHPNRIVQLLEELTRRQAAEGAWDSQVARNFVNLARRHRMHGTLLVNRGTPFEGRAVFKDGDLLRASYGPLLGMDAVREILQLEDASYELDAALEHPDLKIARSTTELEPGRALPPISTGDTVDHRPWLLAVDDEPEMLTMISKFLARAGFEVTTAVDGRDAVNKAFARPFDLVIADLNMPHVDGWEMLKILRADHRTREVPVIFLSAHDDMRETLRAASAGAYDYLAKTGHSDPVVSVALKAITPRLEVLFHLLVNEPVEVRTQVVGLQWTLRALARLKLSGVLELKDDWGSYKMELRGGQPATMVAKIRAHSVRGQAAFARMLVASTARGHFTPGEVAAGTDDFSMSMEELILKACQGLNAAETKAAELRRGATEMDVDPELYGLYRRISSPAKLYIAEGICERRAPLATLAEELQLPVDQVERAYNELLGRGVIRPGARKASPDGSPPTPGVPG